MVYLNLDHKKLTKGIPPNGGGRWYTMTSILDDKGAIIDPYKNFIAVGLDPAIYSNVDWTGKKHLGYTILGKTEIREYPSGNKHHIWRVQCSCGNVFETQAQKIMTGSKGGCQKCYGGKMRGKNSPHWKGGAFVPGYFVAKVQAKLSRKSRLLDYSVTLEYLDDLWRAQNGRCVYTDVELSFGNHVEECTASLDRIDSLGDYVEGNVQFVHKTINKMKWDLTDIEFKSFCVLVAKNL